MSEAVSGNCKTCTYFLDLRPWGLCLHGHTDEECQGTGIVTLVLGLPKKAAEDTCEKYERG